MKSQIYKRLALVAMLFSLVFVVTNVTAKKSVKPPPDQDKTTAEWIVFTGDLVGSQEVVGCCPNAGPFPTYAMTLTNDIGGFSAGDYEGQLFINSYGAGRNREYIVQFWNDDIGIEIIGGVIDNDKKNKILTVTFTNDMCTDLDTGDDIRPVNFVLERAC
jgi:hypothetical protein